jgi:diguanylate cyclase (GGDEF)-like protein/PAS domain S-box-containing protein
VRQNERLAAQEGALRVAGERLVEAETDEDVALVLESATQQLLGSNLLGVGLVMAPFDPSSGGWTAELTPALRAIEAEMESIDTPSTGHLLDLHTVGIEGSWYAGLLVLQGEPWAVLVLGGEKEIGEDQRNAITALCRQGAIATRAVRRTEEQVRERAEQRFGTLIENSSDIVTILDENNILVYTSPVSKRLLGIEPEVGFEFRIPQLIHRDDQDKAQRLLASVQQSGHATEELRLRHVNGTYLWFEVQATNLIDDPDVQGILINARAVDDRKAAEELLLLSEARFKSLVQNNSDLVMVVDAHERVSYVSPSAVAMIGAPPEALFGQPMSGVFVAADMDWNSKLRESAKDGRTFEFGFRHTSGHWRTFETVVTDLRDEPAVGGFVLNARDITERLEMTKDIEYAATHDSLTDMPNRTRLVTQLEEMLSRNSGSSSVTAICIDLDDFRDINDSLGQSIGDDVLRAVADRIRSTLSYGDDAARIGADEFAVIIERAHGEEVVLETAEEILGALAEPLYMDGRELNLSASVGMAVDHSRDMDAESLLRNSITAMHEAKREGRGRVVRFEHSMRTASSDRLELRGDLARAIGTDQLVVNYQPIVDMGTNEIIGAEALVRWDHPERGRLSPGLFIPLAEDSGLIERLDAQVRTQALEDLSSWRSEVPGREQLTMSVNLSVGELYSDELVPSVLRDLRSSGLPADALVLEVTESNLLDDSDAVRSQMESLRAHGIRLAVDDFGTGYSSLGYIDRFDFDILKIDRSFVAGLSNRTNQRIVTAVLDLASQLDAKVIAEGIETDSQKATLLSMGCLVGQGYWFSRPVAADQFRRMLTETVSVGT